MCSIASLCRSHLRTLPLLVQTSPVFVRVLDQVFSSPPSIPNAADAARSAPSRVVSATGSHCVERWVHVVLRRQTSPALPNSASTVRSSRQDKLHCLLLFVCLSEPYRSNFVVPTRFRDLCALIENRVRSAGAHIGHCPSPRQNPNVGTLS